MEFKRSGQSSLDRCQADFAVALKGVAIARGKQCAGHEYGEVDRAADAEFLVVHVAPERPWLFRGESSPAQRRRNAEITEERRKWQFLPPRHFGNVALAVERNMDAAEFGKVLRQGAERRYLQIPAPIGAKLQIQNAHLDHVTGLGSLDVDRACQEIRAGAAKCALQHLLMSGNDTEAERRIRHIVRLAGQGLDRDPIAGCNPQYRLQSSVPKPPMHITWRRSQMMIHQSWSPACATGGNGRGRRDTLAERQIHPTRYNDPDQPAEVRSAQQVYRDRSLQRTDQAVLDRPSGHEPG